MHKLLYILFLLNLLDDILTKKNYKIIIKIKVEAWQEQRQNGTFLGVQEREPKKIKAHH